MKSVPFAAYNLYGAPGCKVTYKPKVFTILYFSFQNVTKTAEEEKPRAPTIQEIEQIINSYNAKVTNCFVMKLVCILFICLHYFRR